MHIMYAMQANQAATKRKAGEREGRARRPQNAAHLSTAFWYTALGMLDYVCSCEHLCLSC